MFLLIIGTACGLCAFVSAIVLQLSLPGWKYLSGLQRVGPERLANIDVPRLRRRLSLILYFLAAGCLAVSAMLSIKSLSTSVAVPTLLALAFVAFDAIFFFWQRFDHNVYSEATRHSYRAFIVIMNVSFALLCAAFAL